MRARTTAPLFRTADFTKDLEGVVQQLLRKALEENAHQSLPQATGETENIPLAKKKKKAKKHKPKKN